MDATFLMSSSDNCGRKIPHPNHDAMKGGGDFGSHKAISYA